ncbi:hypothetical protein [Xenorhabdus littoralis]|uniref:hypothetical protein n=1 Tax=Xenorhabdus littoralis TaxID=2582835 RepID=UPI0029E7E23C|nr:hypothetical protein [Xenorhabdus sp. Reich]
MTSRQIPTSPSPSFFKLQLSSVNEMVAIENGEFQPKPEHVHRHAIPNVKSLREHFGMK